MALAAMGGCVFCYGAAIALGAVALQEITPRNVSRQMIAFHLFVVNVHRPRLESTVIARSSDRLLVARRSFARLGAPA